LLISLSNQKTDAKIRKIIIDVTTKLCILENKGEVHLSLISDFEHPLLTSREFQEKQTHFIYEYDDLESLLQSSWFIYSTMIIVANPVVCTFEIKPSPHYIKTPSPKYFKISLNPKKEATETITIVQLNQIVSEINGSPFEYQEDIIINTFLTINDLPKKVDGDLILKKHKRTFNLLQQPPFFQGFELRLIDSFIGFAIFATEKIPKDSIIGFYTGIKKIEEPGSPSLYIFSQSKDILNLITDAQDSGNFTRFINHAPDASPDPQWKPLLANIDTFSKLVNGTEIVMYITKSDIEVGDQLLIDYGKKYFIHRKEIYFNNEGEYFNEKKKRIKPKNHSLDMMWVLAHAGVKKAQSHLTIRYLSVFLIILVVIVLINALG
jgi:hypothetical protein